MDDDSTEHTISGCPEWLTERSALIRVIGPDLSLSGIVRAITANKDGWLVFAKFAENIMRKKEDAETGQRGRRC